MSTTVIGDEGVLHSDTPAAILAHLAFMKEMLAQLPNYDVPIEPPGVFPGHVINVKGIDLQNKRDRLSIKIGIAISVVQLETAAGLHVSDNTKEIIAHINSMASELAMEV